MLQDITLGQYYPGNSILHRLDPRTKFLGTLIFIVGLFLVQGVIGYTFVTVVLLALIFLSQVPWKIVLKGLRAVLFILILTMLFNIFLIPGKVIAQWWIFRITEEGLYTAIRMGIRLVYLVTGSTLLTLTTIPTAMTDAMESLFRPLKVFHVPVHEIAMMMSIPRQGTGAAFGAALCFCLPASQRPRPRNGGALLSRRRGTHTHEAPPLREAGCYRVHPARRLYRSMHSLPDFWFIMSVY